MPRALGGVLVECDASIKSIIVAIDKENHDYIIEDLDECRVFVKANKVAQLKHKLEERLKANTAVLEDEVDENDSD